MPKKSYKCNNCNHLSANWLGKCPDCDKWETFEEVVVEKEIQSSTNISKNSGSVNGDSIKDLLKKSRTEKNKLIFPFAAPALNHFWGGGINSGSYTLMAGEPGIGKSTLSLQLLRALENGNKGINLLYITAEESSTELARRAERLGIPDNIRILQANNYDQIEKALKSQKPNVVIIDSVQTIYTSDSNSAPGSTAQVSTLSHRFLAIAKSLDIAIVIVGHVTKDGSIAGPKTLEHMVDSVIIIEQSDNKNFRTLSFSKHRFGSIDNMLLMVMEEDGLHVVKDPSLALLENLEEGVGIVYSAASHLDLCVVAEIQALVSNLSPGESFKSARQAIGFSNSKLQAILAIGEKYLGLDLSGRDVFVQISGLPRGKYDDSLDFAVLLSIICSFKSTTINELLKTGDKKSLICARLSLSGNIRKPTNYDERVKTAKKLGFVFNPSIEYTDLSAASFMR